MCVLIGCVLCYWCRLTVSVHVPHCSQNALLNLHKNFLKCRPVFEICSLLLEIILLVLPVPVAATFYNTWRDNCFYNSLLL